MVVDHRLVGQDPFALTTGGAEHAIVGYLLEDQPLGMKEVGDLLVAA
jgi:hypothetical protein